MKSADLIMDFAESNMDLYYATKFNALTKYIFFKIGPKKYLLLNDLEIDHAKKKAVVDAILPLRLYLEKAKTFSKKPSQLDAVVAIFREKKVKKIVVPQTTSFLYVDELKKAGFTVVAGTQPFYTSRLNKTKSEKRCIIDAQRAIFSAIGLVENMIRRSVIKKGILYLEGKPLTSERCHEAVSFHLFKEGYFTTLESIVACGNQGTGPHETGSGPLRPHQSIIVDIYSKSLKTGYWGDATRTFCKGRASDKLRKQYETVRIAQANAIKQVRPGVNGKNIHENIIKFFKETGYQTGEIDGQMQGFFHGTGHGIGLVIHEEPLRINQDDFLLEEGFITSVEPGLYYKDIGGVRLEDLVYITKTGCKVLGYYPKKLEIK